MKRALTLMILAVSLMLAARADEAMVNVYGRKSVSLNGEWQALPDYMCNGHYRQVWLERKPQGKSDFYEVSFDGTPAINVPGDFNSQLDNMKYSECQVWYKREFEHVKANDSNRVFLHFGAVNYKAEVYLNSELIGTHEGGYTPFQIEVTDKVKADPNSLIVMANNQRHADALPAQGFDWFGYGGITRDVCLVETPAAYVDDYFIALDGKSLDTVASTLHVDGGEAVVTVDIPELKFHKTLQTTDSEATFSTQLKPQLWSPDSPKLYDITLVCNGDTIRDRIGFRTIEADGRDIKLNGKPIFLKAVNIHEETLGHPSRAWSLDHARQHLNIAKELGCNMVRLAHYPHNEHMVRLAEEMGILVWDEIPVYQGIAFSSPGVPEKIEAMMLEMVRRDRNRCAVIVWSLSNETWDSYAGRTEVLSALTDKCRALDSSRLITHIINTQGYDNNTIKIWDPLYDACDLICLNEYIGWYVPWQGKPSDVQWQLPSDKPVFVSEFGGEAKYDSNYGPKDAAGYWSEEYQAQIYRDQIEMFRATERLAGVCPWILCDYLSLVRMHPVYQNGYNRKGLVDEHGNRKQAFYIMQQYYRSK